MKQPAAIITKEQFLAYEKVRRSGKTNMFAVNKVIALAGEKLTKLDCLEIMKNYSLYREVYLKEYPPKDMTPARYEIWHSTDIATMDEAYRFPQKVIARWLQYPEQFVK